MQKDKTIIYNYTVYWPINLIFRKTGFALHYKLEICTHLVSDITTCFQITKLTNNAISLLYKFKQNWITIPAFFFLHDDS